MRKYRSFIKQLWGSESKLRERTIAERVMGILVESGLVYAIFQVGDLPFFLPVIYDLAAGLLMPCIRSSKPINSLLCSLVFDHLHPAFRKYDRFRDRYWLRSSGNIPPPHPVHYQITTIIR